MSPQLAPPWQVQVPFPQAKVEAADAGRATHITMAIAANIRLNITPPKKRFNHASWGLWDPQVGVAPITAHVRFGSRVDGALARTF